MELYSSVKSVEENWGKPIKEILLLSIELVLFVLKVKETDTKMIINICC